MEWGRTQPEEASTEAEKEVAKGRGNQEHKVKTKATGKTDTQWIRPSQVNKSLERRLASR